jgi:hypothetical protein
MIAFKEIITVCVLAFSSSYFVQVGFSLIISSTQLFELTLGLFSLIIGLFLFSPVIFVVHTSVLYNDLSDPLVYIPAATTLI